MFGLKITFKDETKKVAKAADKAAFRNVAHALASIMGGARRSIRRRKGASEVGTPPNTRRGLIKRAIRFQVAEDKKSGVAGPMASIAGKSGSAHEFGGIYKGQEFDERPFMAPELERAYPRFAGSFAGSIGE